MRKIRILHLVQVAAKDGGVQLEPKRSKPDRQCKVVRPTPSARDGIQRKRTNDIHGPRALHLDNLTILIDDLGPNTLTVLLCDIASTRLHADQHHSTEEDGYGVPLDRCTRP